MRFCILGLTLIFGLGCTGASDLIVEVRSDFRPSEEFSLVRIALHDGPPGATGTTIVRTVDITPAPNDDFARGHRVTTFGDVEPGAYVLEVTLLQSAVVLAAGERSVQVEGTSAASVLITRCDGQSTCSLTACVTAADCPSLSDCAIASCEESQCFFSPGECGSDRCRVEIGCTPGSIDGGADAGIFDAGSMDAGTDAPDGGFDGGNALEWEIRGRGFEFCAFRRGEPGLYCWGRNGQGVVGTGTPGIAVISPRNIAPNEEPVRDASVGEGHACAIFGEGEVWCWGENDDGQLGDGTTEDRGRPTRNLVSGATSVTAGYRLSCATLATGQTVCWGNNDVGELGRGVDSDFETSPAPVTGLSGAVQLTIGFGFVCALTDSAQVACWGSGWRLGRPRQDASNVPLVVPALTDVVEVRAGADLVCVRKSDGGVQCWGENRYGAIGNGTFERQDTPASVMGIESATYLAPGLNTVFALDDAGQLFGWGRNVRGKLGIGDMENRNTAIRLTIEDTFIRLATITRSSCGVSSTGVYCWGQNEYGQLGIGTAGPAVTTPQRVTELPY